MKTQLDLYNCATAAAAGSLDLNTPFEVTMAALESFRTEKHDPRDYDTWLRFFNEQRTLMLNLRAAKAPSALAATA